MYESLSYWKLFNINNIFNSGGYSMTRTKPLVPAIDYMNGFDAGEEYTDMSSSRNGRTYSITLKYNFGKMQEEKRRFRHSQDRGRGTGGTDMGY